MMEISNETIQKAIAFTKLERQLQAAEDSVSTKQAELDALGVAEEDEDGLRQLAQAIANAMSL